MVICLEQGADLHMAQLMPLPLAVSCFCKIHIGFTFLYRLTWVVPDKGPLNGCVRVCVLYYIMLSLTVVVFLPWSAMVKYWTQCCWLQQNDARCSAQFVCREYSHWKASVYNWSSVNFSSRHVLWTNLNSRLPEQWPGHTLSTWALPLVSDFEYMPYRHAGTWMDSQTFTRTMYLSFALWKQSAIINCYQLMKYWVYSMFINYAGNLWCWTCCQSCTHGVCICHSDW